MKYFKNPIILYIIIGFLVLANIASVSYFLIFNYNCPKCNEPIMEAVAVLNEEEKEESINKIHVDIKGFIKNPGVYEMDEGTIVNDLINVAGGLKKGATTENINLSKKLVDEAIVIIASKTELNSKKTCQEAVENNNNPENFAAINNEVITGSNSSNEQNNQVNNGKISINKASKEELMTLSGIGEKTAEKIIEYRNNQSFSSIEDVKNVSGIGEALFEKIKDNITI